MLRFGRMRYEDMYSRPTMIRMTYYGAFDMNVQQASGFGSLRMYFGL